ncbi:357_t:CDS:2 [Funneliformis caledonium]|uniref:357_t:CDS:1 n=1 Tax=Funneliformis caledonium TaxID=1117310 RepID=A0A9N8ZGP0_9GLOM|nr:357_t:CDS:2 [Funneliformis caledonium]
MAGFQNSNKLYTDSSNTNTALTTASAHYKQTKQHHPTTPTSPAPTLSNNTTTTPGNKTESRITSSNSTTSTTTTNTQTSNNNSSSNPNSPAGSRSLTSTATQTSPASLPHSAFSPYNQIPQQHPTPVTTPTATKNSISSQQEPSTMMTTSHLDNSGSTTLIYPPHTHFANPTSHPFWPPNQWGFNGANGTAVLSANGGSAFVPAVGYSPAASNIAPGHAPRPKLTTTIWEDEGTLCYQVDARGICVARRQDNDMINGTKLLNVVGMSRGKRDGILKNEKGRVVVKVGAMHLKGVWITFQRAKTLAAQFKISELLYPLFVDDPSIFLHNSYGPPMSTRIPSIGGGPTSQWRPTHPYANNFNNAAPYSETTRQWYPYGNGNLMGSPSTPQGQEHGSAPYPPNSGYPDRSANVATPPAVPIYSTHPPTRNHNAHPQAHLEEYETSYGLINGQSQGQQGVTVVSGPAVSSYNLSPTEFKNSSTAGFYAIPQNAGYFGHHQQRPTPPPSTYDVSINRSSTNSPNLYNTHVKTEDNTASNGNGYIRSGQGLYNLVSAADVVGGSPAQGSPQLIGQKRSFGEEENDDYNSVNNSSQPSPPLAMHPPPPLSSIAVSTAMNVAAGSFPSPMHVSPNSSPGNSAFTGWNHSGKRVKYEQFPEATTPSSAQSSPRTAGYQLPVLGTGPATPGANPSTPQGYTNSNLQMVTNAQGSPHHYTSASNNNGGPATGTTTPTTEGLDRYFEQSTVLHTPSPDSGVSTPAEESNTISTRRYEYRRDEPPANEELAGNGGWE